MRRIAAVTICLSSASFQAQARPIAVGTIVGNSDHLPEFYHLRNGPCAVVCNVDGPEMSRLADEAKQLMLLETT